MRFDIITLFPNMIMEVLGTSILKRASISRKVQFFTHDPRQHATDTHKSVDDTPYGGGAGMVLRVDILVSCLRTVQAELDKAAIPSEKRRTLLLCPQGETFSQALAENLATTYEQVTLICGHYEGFDERIRHYVDGQLSIGNYVVTGGELPALIVVDAVSRLLPGVITEGSPEEESFSLTDEHGNPLLEYPQYTRPYEFEGQTVPDILLSGNHAAIKAWRLEQAKLRTKQRS